MMAVIHNTSYQTTILNEPDWSLECFGIHEKISLETNRPIQLSKKYDIVSDLYLKGEGIVRIELADFATSKLLYSESIDSKNEVKIPIWFSNNTPSLTSTSIKVSAKSATVDVEYTGIFNKDRTII